MVSSSTQDLLSCGQWPWRGGRLVGTVWCGSLRQGPPEMETSSVREHSWPVRGLQANTWQWQLETHYQRQRAPHLI